MVEGWAAVFLGAYLVLLLVYTDLHHPPLDLEHLLRSQRELWEGLLQLWRDC
jgi:hypothetical protein